MSVRWKDKADITALAAGDRMPVTDVSDSNVDKYATPAEIATYVKAAGNLPTTPGTVTDDAVPRYDGTDGLALKNSGVTIDDNNFVAGAAGVGIGGATPDATNRLSANTPAVLFNRETDDIQVKLNKAASGDTASFLFQTGFSGRAEIGTTGDDDFHFKVSPDGSTFHEGLIIDKDNGAVSAPNNLSTVNLTQTGYHDLTEIAEPSSPAANVARVYAFDEGGTTKLGIKDAAGAVTWIGSGVGLPTGSAINWNSGNVTLTHAAGSLTLDGDLLFTPGQTLTVAPTGNSTSSKSSLSLQATAAHASTREFAVDLGLTSSVGEGVGTPGGDKVTLYSGAIANDGSGGIWAANFLVHMASGFSEACTGLEIDLDNLSEHRGDASLANGAWDLQISGASTFRSTGAILISGSTVQWNRGITFANDCIVLTTFEDNCDAATVFDINGSHTTGLDFTGATISGNAIALASGHKIDWNGDVSITHASNTLTFAGADTAYAFASDEDAGTTSLRIHNTGDGNVTTKLAALNFYGRDTVGADKEAARVEAQPADANWVGGDLRFYTRDSDAVAERLRIQSNGMLRFAAPSFVANGAGTVTISNLRPAGAATATITRWLTFIDEAGVDSYIPVWQ